MLKARSPLAGCTGSSCVFARPARPTSPRTPKSTGSKSSRTRTPATSYTSRRAAPSRWCRRSDARAVDAQWIQRLHTYGLLRGSFRAADAVLKLRACWRQRQLLIRLAAMHVQHMHKAFEQMNVKLTEVLSDITGVTGMLIITAILAGKRDAQ